MSSISVAHITMPLIAAVVLLWSGLVSHTPTVIAQQETPLSPPAAELDAQVAVKWMQLLYDRAEAEAISAPAASRLYAYAGITAYQAALPGMPTGITLGGQLNGMPGTPPADPDQVYDWASSVNEALAVVLTALLPESSQREITALRNSLIRSRERDLDPEIVARSLAYGESVAAAILDWVEDDNFVETRGQPFDVPTGDPSYWIPTAAEQQSVEPYWGAIRPFALYYADACALPMNMAFSTDPDSVFYAQALEVKTVGDNLTNEQKDIARYWVDTPGQTGTPAGHWVLIQNQLVSILDLKLERATMMYALVGIALGDSFIAAWSLKYQLLLLRPETYINRYIDPNWRPFIATPNFPEYPSGHSVVSAAAAEVLTGMFGQVAFTDRSAQIHGHRPRSFTSFEAAASEAAISRMYGGIHFRAAIENGMRMGRCIGQNALNYVTLRPVPQGE